MKRKCRWATKGGALLLSAVMLSGSMMTGCGKSALSDKGQTKDKAVSDNLNETGLPILKEKKTFTVAVKQISSIKRAEEKKCVIDTENDTNVHIQWIEIPDSAWKEKINIMFSTDSMPDLIIGPVDTSKYYEQIIAYDDYMEKYAPLTSQYFKTRDEYPKILIAPDGKIHGLPTGDEVLVNVIDSQYWINMDWLKKVGKEMPTTPEEFKDVLIAFRDEDPNGNGLKDEVPFTFNKLASWGDAIENFFGPWGVIENGYHIFTKDGKVTFGAKQQGYYDALAYLHDLYKEGLIDKEVFTLSTEQYQTRGASGDIIGVMAGYRGSECSVENGEPGVDRYHPLPLLKGKDQMQMTGLNNIARDGGFHITTACKDPAALVRWYDYINSTMEEAAKWNRGIRGVNYDVEVVDGKEIPISIPMTKESLKENGGYKTSSAFRTAECFAGQSPAMWKIEWDRDLKSTSPFPDLKRDAILEQMPYGVNGLPGSSLKDPADAERKTILFADIDTYLQKFVADSVINGIDDAKWQTHLKNLEALKADEYESLCQKQVDEYNSQK